LNENLFFEFCYTWAAIYLAIDRLLPVVLRKPTYIYRY